MKFICEKCDIPFDFEMKENLSKESMKVTFCCIGCDARFSVVTNSDEGNALYSLGVKIGEKENVEPLEITHTATDGGEVKEEREKNPIWTPEAEERLNNVPSSMRSMAKGIVEKLAKDKGCAVIDAALMDEARDKFIKGIEAKGEGEESPVWTPEAQERLNNVPSFGRPIAKSAVEKLAKDKGCTVIDEALMDEARDKCMRGKEEEAKGEREEALIWTPKAEERLNNVPSFVRPMAKRAVEKLAREKGQTVIDEALMDEARGKFMGECKE